MTDDRRRLLDIVDAIDQIDRYSARGRTAFESDELIQVWVVHHLERIGEAVRLLSGTTRTVHPDVPWQQIIGMRNILAHHYWDIDLDEVWNTVQRDLPPLRMRIATILEALDPPSDATLS